jgi:glyoxylase-like metal-dependent hydrolase (beta-lactamase superfamily II)
MPGARIELVTTNGIFSLDGQDFEVENNIWLIGDDHEVVVIDAAHDAAPIVDAVGDRRVTAIVCTHGHNDHINAADDLARATGAPVMLHEADRMLWDVVYPTRPPDEALREGAVVRVAGTDLRVLHTPGHSPGGVCLYWSGAEPRSRSTLRAGAGATRRARPDGHVFGGDTLFKGGPGATGRSFSDFPTIITSIRERLLTLPPGTVVHTGHGDSTTVGEEAPHLDEWVARGH